MVHSSSPDCKKLSVWRSKFPGRRPTNPPLRTRHPQSWNKSYAPQVDLLEDGHELITKLLPKTLNYFRQGVIPDSFDENSHKHFKHLWVLDCRLKCKPTVMLPIGLWTMYLCNQKLRIWTRGLTWAGARGGSDWGPEDTMHAHLYTINRLNETFRTFKMSSRAHGNMSSLETWNMLITEFILLWLACIDYEHLDSIYWGENMWKSTSTLFTIKLWW